MDSEPNKADPVLCYVDDCWAYFTTQKLSDQWGDDWNDTPYEHNAGTPYDPHHYDTTWGIVRVAFSSGLERPCDGQLNSRYSVEYINSGAVPWLCSPDYVKENRVRIDAGTPLSKFIAMIEADGGTVYLPRSTSLESTLRRCVEALKAQSDVGEKLAGYYQRHEPCECATDEPDCPVCMEEIASDLAEQALTAADKYLGDNNAH